MATVAKKTAKKTRQTSRSRRSVSKRTMMLRIALLSFSISFSIETTHKPVRKTTKLKQKAKRRSNPRKTMPYALVAAGLIGMMITGYGLLRTTSHTSSPARYPIIKDEPAVAPTPSLARSDATRLKIASINVDAAVDIVGQAADGTVEVPSKPDVVGQYKLAPTPGEMGPAVIVGHVDSLLGTAVFWRLRELTPGQEIEVERKDGTVARFVVERIEEFDQAQFPTQQVYGNIDYPGLRLITCSGAFNLLSRTYDKNIVVFARLNAN